MTPTCKHCGHEDHCHYKWNCSECSKIGKQCPGFELEIEQAAPQPVHRHADSAEHLGSLADCSYPREMADVGLRDAIVSILTKCLDDEGVIIHEDIDALASDIAAQVVAERQAGSVACVKEAFEIFNKALRETDDWWNSQLFVDLAAAIDALDAPASVAELVWTSTIPDKPGFYWRRLQKRTGEVVETGPGRTVYKDGRWVRIEFDTDMEWAGPIPEPEMK